MRRVNTSGAGRASQICAAVMLVMFVCVSESASTPCFVVTNDLREDYSAARAVFLGEVVKVEELSASEVLPTEERRIVERRSRVTFKVEHSWKGAGFLEFVFAEVEALSSSFEGACYLTGVSFVEGNKYLVFAAEDENKNLTVMQNGRTKPIGNASEDMQALRRLDAAFLFSPKRRP